jgi:ATP-dependent RNA helicase RhlE
MGRVNISSLTLHGGKEQEDRTSVMNDFKDGTAKLLIATDVSARGIDIQGINYVVNYDIPDVAENYVHRVGRTGRGQAKGFAVSFCSMEEKELLDAIEAFIGNEINIVEIKADDYEKTLDFTEDPKSDWKTLMKEAEKEAVPYKKKKKKK